MGTVLYRWRSPIAGPGSRPTESSACSSRSSRRRRTAWGWGSPSADRSWPRTAGAGGAARIQIAGPPFVSRYRPGPLRADCALVRSRANLERAQDALDAGHAPGDGLGLGLLIL